MKKTVTITVLFFLITTYCSCKNSLHDTSSTNDSISAFDTIALTPPMGWNSWNCYATDINEEQVKANATYMSEKLRTFGWQYIVVDLGWYLKKGVSIANFKMQNPPQSMDFYGRLIPSTHKFPSATDSVGFKALATYVHSLGLKFGIHIMRGIPRAAVEQNLPIKGTGYSAKEIATITDTCGWYAGMYGVDMTKPGAQEYYNSLIEMYSSWGVDFIKADDMSFPYHKAEIEGLSNAIKGASRPIVLSLSPGAAPLKEVLHLQKTAHMWRVSPDFWDDWKFLKRQFELCRSWQNHRMENHWPDCDMLPLGKLRKNGPDDYVAKAMKKRPGEITNEYSRFTTNEKYTLMTLWCIFRSPLMMGGNLPENDSLTLQLLTNKEAIYINQYSIANHEVKADRGIIIWAADDISGKTKYVALFNINDKNKMIATVNWNELGIKGSYRVYDIWNNRDLGLSCSKLQNQINPHGAGFYKLTSE